MTEERIFGHMTENYFEKKSIREYAEKRGLKYTEAKAILEPLDMHGEKRDVRVGLDDIKSEIVDHPRVDMMKRPDGLGYMNGSLDAGTIRSWIPLLDKLDSDRWKLVNGGPGWNSLSYDDAEDHPHAEPPLYCGEYEDGEPTDDVFHTTHRLDQIDGLSVMFYAQFPRDDAGEIIDRLRKQNFVTDKSSARLDIARGDLTDDQWIDHLAAVLNAAALAFEKSDKTLIEESALVESDFASDADA